MPRWIIGIGASWGRNTSSFVPHVMPCCQPRKTCLIADFCPVWDWKRAGSPVIPSRSFETSGRAPAPGRQRENDDHSDESRFIGRERSAFTTFPKASSSSGGRSSSENQRSSATSSAGVGSPETMRAVQ